MTGRILRGRMLGFHRQPEAPDDTGSYLYLEDGGIAIADGRIVAVGDFGDIQGRPEFRGGSMEDSTADSGAAPRQAFAVVDHRPHLIMPGLIDPHIHFVQMQVVGSYAAALLEWLNTYTFVEEQKFSDPVHAQRIASAFFDELIRQGTTTAAAYCSVHPQSADAFFAEAEKRGMAMLGGKCLMDRNCPEPLRDSPQTGYDDTKKLIAKWHRRGRARYAITPRFAITSTPEQMQMVAALADEYPDCPIQTHLSENAAEIALALDLFPNDDSYAAIYARHGMMRANALYGHAIHLSDAELALMAETQAVAVSCPTSNLFLGSGLYDLGRADAAGIRTAVATDIGGGTSYSMLETMDEFYKVQQIAGNRVFPLLAFDMLTRRNAAAVGLSSEIGSIAAGLFADLVVLDAGATPAMALRMETVDTLAEELFVLQTMGDDRAVAETYVAGEPLKSALG